MKKFLLKTIIVSVGFVALCGLNFIANVLIIKFSKVPLREKQVLIAGDSHPQFAVNPDIFYSAANICQTGEPYPLTYWKLKYLFKDYQPEVLLLGFAHHNISSFNDHKFVDPKWSGELFKRSYLVGNFSALGELDIELDYSTYYRTFLREMFLYPHLDHFRFVGSYSGAKESRLSDVKSLIDRHYFVDEKPAVVSEASIAYLDSIVHLCTELKIRTVLVATPVHREYHKRIPSTISSRYALEKDRMAARGISVFDLSTDYFDDSYFYDEDHLNEKGAFIFTHRIIEMLPSKEEPAIRFVRTATR